MAKKVWRIPPPPPKPDLQPPAVDFVSMSEGAEVLRVVGGKALINNILQLPKMAREAAAREMAVILHEVIVDAQDTYVPVDTGDLRDSGDSDEYAPGTIQPINSMAAWFGGEPTVEQLAHGKKDVRKYALEQHENMEFKHTVGGPKYLEIPFTNKLAEIPRRLGLAIGAYFNLQPAFGIDAFPLPSDPLRAVDPDLGGK